jgi:hypothetical protein
LLTHVIFSIQDRQPLLTPDLLAYMGGIIRNLRGNSYDERYIWE